MTSRKIYLDAPCIGELEKQYLIGAIDSGYVSTIGPFVPQFEKEFANYLNLEGAVATQSGTAALHVALHELGIGPGDEVIVPALTFVATVNPIVYLGAKPVFADVDRKTWTIDPAEISYHISERTKAIIPVHLYGNPCKMDEIVKIADRYGITIVEDATESLGSKYKGRFTGTFGKLACFSFNGNKIITTGGGGMVVGKDQTKLAHIKYLVNQARHNEEGVVHSEIGFNYRMTNIEAALGLAQLGQLDYFLSKRRRFNELYRTQLQDLPSVTFQETYEDTENSYWFSCIFFENNMDITKLQQELSRKGIPTRRIFAPITEFPPYKHLKNADLTNTYHLFQGGLCLPSSGLNSNEDIYYICQTLKELIH